MNHPTCSLNTTKTCRQLSCSTLKIDRLSYAVVNVAAPCNNNTKSPSNQTCAGICFSSDETYGLTDISSS